MRHLALVAVTSCFIACSPGLDVPEGTAIECHSNAECPEKFVCQTTLSRCVPFGFDVTSPALVAPPAISPSTVGTTTTVTMSFEATKRLGIDPVVLVSFGAATTFPAKIATKSDDQTVFTYTYTPSGNEPQGYASVQIIITDVVGNQGVSETPTALFFDFVAPQIFGSPSVRIVPATSTVLATVSAVTFGSTIDVDFQASEVLGDATSVTIDDVPVIFSRTSALGALYTYSAVLAAGTTLSDGAHTMHITVVDAAGNSSTLEVPVAFDTTAPAPPAISVADAIVYHRAPWSAQPHFTVTASAGAFEAGATVVVTDENGGIIGQGVAAGDGGLAAPLVLLDTDHLDVRVQSVDNASNASASVRIIDVEWRAQLDGTAGNPHNAFVLSRTGRELRQSDAASITPAQATSLGSIDDNVANFLSAGFSRPWVRRDASPLVPSERFGQAAVFDGRRGQMVVFGGSTDQFTIHGMDEQWIWNGTSWTEVTAKKPPSRMAHAMAYDISRDRVVLYGGANNSTTYADTWEWDGERWLQITPAHSPGVRIFHAMDFDRDRNRVLLFGGCSDTTCSSPSNQTWAWDGNDWTQVPGGAPTARFGHSLTYYNGAMVVYGGCRTGLNIQNANCGGSSSASNYLKDRWQLGSSGWTNISDGSEPPVRAFHSAAWDEADNLYIIGGATPDGNGDSTVWVSDGSTFFDSGIIGSPGVALGSLVYDRTRGQLLQFAGQQADQLSLLVYGTLRMLGPDNTLHVVTDPDVQTHPTGTTDGGMAFNMALQQSVLSGGFFGGSPSVRPPSFGWSGAYWDTNGSFTPVCPSSSVPHAGQSAYDANRGKLVTLCGNRTYEQTGSSWSEVCTASGCNSGLAGERSGYGMTYDALAHRIVAFGGGNPNGTVNQNITNTAFAYAGSSWSQITCSGTCPVARRCTQLAYDTLRNKVMMFGGFKNNTGGFCTDAEDGDDAGLADTWELSGTTWTQGCKGACVAPPKRSRGLLVYDAPRARTVMVGEGYQDMWEYDGSTWRNVTPSGVVPPSRIGSQVTYDPIRDVIVLYGGQTPISTQRTDLWELDMSPDQRPAILFDFDWNAAGVSRSNVRSVAVHVRAGGHGNDVHRAVGDVVGVKHAGAQIEAWNPTFGWASEAGTASDIVAPLGDATRSEVTDCGSPLLYPSDGHIYARVSPSYGSGNGTEDPQVAVDFGEAVVRYRVGQVFCN